MTGGGGRWPTWGGGGPAPTPEASMHAHGADPRLCMVSSLPRAITAWAGHPSRNIARQLTGVEAAADTCAEHQASTPREARIQAGGAPAASHLSSAHGRDECWHSQSLAVACSFDRLVINPQAGWSTPSRGGGASPPRHANSLPRQPQVGAALLPGRVKQARPASTAPVIGLSVHANYKPCQTNQMCPGGLKFWRRSPRQEIRCFSPARW